MNAKHQLWFPPFRLDLVNEQLWRDTEEIPLRRKTFAVLRYLVEHSSQLVTKESLLDAVWAGTTVSDVAPGVCVQELRRALGDDRQTPRFIVTVHRRGYRFLPAVTTSPPEVSSQHSIVSSPVLPTQSSALSPQHLVLVGRETELQQLHNWLSKALDGERQIVFVTGEPGIGKTSLLEAFVAGVRDQEKNQTSKSKVQKFPRRSPQPSILSPCLHQILTPNSQILASG
jgi:DNA-binding winged helix-turn-helix (wHTH) protein